MSTYLDIKHQYEWLCGSKKVTDAVTHSPMRMLDMLTVLGPEENTLGSAEEPKVELKPENEWQLNKVWLERKSFQFQGIPYPQES